MTFRTGWKFLAPATVLQYGDGRGKKLGEGTVSNTAGHRERFNVAGTAAHSHGPHRTSNCDIPEFKDDTFVYFPESVKAVLQREGLLVC